METQEQLLQCPFCGLEQRPDVAGWTSDEGFETRVWEEILRDCPF
jgi:hypothetical protein